MAIARVLVVEDEGTVAVELADTLREFGYAVPAVADCATEALDAMAAHEIDIVLMDIGLAGETDGIEAAEMIADSSHVPVVYTTAYSDSDTVERVKRTAPFGYLVKPIDPNTLHSTIQIALAQSRRVEMLTSTVDSGQSGSTLEESGLVLDTRSRTILFGGERIQLTPTESSLLEYLMTNKGRVCSREEIIRNVWAGHPHVSTNSVDVYVRYLRKKLRLDSDSELIASVRGRGYLFAAP